ncbi:hypothetical protein PC123_g12232 [Phytophthora cactorum]|nr:hypothetical protein PC123_g12232 [Phytophthora cactorum]
MVCYFVGEVQGWILPRLYIGNSVLPIFFLPIGNSALSAKSALFFGFIDPDRLTDRTWYPEYIRSHIGRKTRAYASTYIGLHNFKTIGSFVNNASHGGAVPARDRRVEGG